MRRLAIFGPMLLLLASCTTDDVFPAFQPTVVQLDAAALTAEYVGGSFQSEHGDTIRFNADGTYLTGDGRRGSYAINPPGVLTLVGEPGSFHITPAGQRLDRPDLGLSMTVRKQENSFIHIVSPGNQSGAYRKLPPGSAF